MAKMPSGAKLIHNPSSAAPGFITKMFYHFWSSIDFKFNDRKL